MYRLMGLAHVHCARVLAALRRQSGQGTAEYVTLILLVEIFGVPFVEGR